MTLPNGTGHESPPDGVVGQDRDGNAEEEVNRQLVELDRIERAAPSRGRVQFSMLQGTDVEVSNRAPQQGATSLSSACAMEAIFEDEEGSPQKSPDLNSNGAAQPKPPQMETFEQSEQLPTDGRRTLASRKKMTAAEIEALEHSPAEQLDGDGEFCFSHTPLDQDDDDDDDEDKQTRRQSGSTRNILEAVKNQLQEQLIRQGIGKAASSEAVDLRDSRQEDSRSHRSSSRPTRAQSEGDGSLPSSAQNKQSAKQASWAFRMLRHPRRVEEVLSGTGSDDESISRRNLPARKALTLKQQLLQPMMSWVVRGSGKVDSKHREERITVPGEEEMARALLEGTARALGGELFRPLNDMSGQYTLSGEEEDDQNEEEKLSKVEKSSVLWRWYSSKTAQITSSDRARNSKCLSWFLGCINPNKTNGDQEEWHGMANAVQYLRCILALALVVLDLVTVLIYQVFWGDDNFICRAEIDRPGPQTNPVALLATSTCLHFMDFAYVLASRDATGRFAGLSYFAKNRDVVGRSSRERRLWHLAVFILSSVFFICNVMICDENFLAKEDTYEVWVLRRSLFFFLCLRSINAVQICFGLRKEVKRRLRIAVSQNKRRFVSTAQSGIDPDIDLDLTYICDRLIAMSLPCVVGVVYRNDISDVARFFRERHYGKYKVYNLCEAHESKGNGNYDCSLLYHQVQKFPFRDHNAPPFEVLVNFCEDATAWLNEQGGNVVSVHCQGGKGRTGTFCSSLMLWVGHRRSAEEALKCFESRRRDIKKGLMPHQGVTAPSQIRYVNYLENVIKTGIDFVSKKRRLLKKIVLTDLPIRFQRGCKITFVVEAGGVVQYDHGKAKGLTQCPEQSADQWVIHIGGSGVVVYGDVAVRFFFFANEHASIPSTQLQGYALRAPATLTNGGRTISYDGSQLGEQLCFVQFHSTFHEGNILFPRSEIDGVYNKSELEFGPGFSLELVFEDITAQMHSSHDRTVRNCTLAHTVQSIVERIQPRTKKFYKGEVIYDPQKMESNRMVRFIVSGIAKQYMTGTDETKSVINNGVSRHGDCIAAGDFDSSGLLAFILGHGCIKTDTELRAWTEVVEVRELSVGGGPEDMITHLTFNNATHEDSALIWELIACQLSSGGKKSWVQKKEVAKNVDEIAQHRIRAVKLVKDARNHFNLSSSENLLGMCPADRVVEDEGGLVSVPGNVVALQNWLLFREAGNKVRDKPQDIMISFENISKVLAFGKVLSVHLNVGSKEQVAQETALATFKQSSPARSPTPGSPRFRASRRNRAVETKGRAKPSSAYTVPSTLPSSSLSGPAPLPVTPEADPFLSTAGVASAGQTCSNANGVQRDSVSRSRVPTSDAPVRSSLTAPGSVDSSSGSVVGGGVSPLRYALNSITGNKSEESSGSGNRSPLRASRRRGSTEGANRDVSPRLSFTLSKQNSSDAMPSIAVVGGDPSSPNTNEQTDVTRLHFRAKDAHSASSISSVLQTRLGDIQAGQAKTLIRSSLYGPFGRVRPGYMGFGYSYPGEVSIEGDEDFFRLLAMASTVCTYHSGETMVHLGTTDRNVLHILTGWVVCYTGDGEQVAQLGPGEIMGEVSFLEMGSLGARTQCVAHTDVECRVVSFAALQVLSRQPLFAARFYRGLAISCAVRCLYSLDTLNVRRRKFSTEMPTSEVDLLDNSVE